MSVLTINTITVLAISAVICDLLFQIAKVSNRHSSLDVSPLGVTIRTIAASALIIKFVAVHDDVLIIGQIAMSLALITYMVMVIRYHHFSKKRGKKWWRL